MIVYRSGHAGYTPSCGQAYTRKMASIRRLWCIQIAHSIAAIHLRFHLNMGNEPARGVEFEGLAEFLESHPRPKL